MGVVMNVGAVLSLIAGTVAGTMGFLAWLQFRGTPFGRLLAIIPMVYTLFVGFHAFLLVTGAGHGGGHMGSVGLVEIFETLAFAGLLVFTIQAVRLHGKMSRRSGGKR